MRFASVTHILGLLLMFLAVAMLAPIPFSLFYGDDDVAALGIAAALTFFCGFAGYAITRFQATDLRGKEGFGIVAFGWIAFSLFGSVPFVLSGAVPSYTDAFFETMSGFTTTGASILTDIEALPHGILFWRSLTHWIGGMGIIVLTIAILPFLGVGGMQLFKAEVAGPVKDRLTPRIAETAKILWSVYVAFTVLGTVLLMLGGMNLFDALCHAFGALATGGYCTRNASIGAYPSAYIQYVIIAIMLAGATNFALHYQLFRGDWKAWFRDHEWRLFLFVIGAATVVVGADTFAHHYTGIEKTFRDTLFQVVSIGTTTGYSTADFERWSFSSQFVLIVLMIFGGCVGSTSGGLKMMRVHLLVKFVFSEVTRVLHPRAVIPVRAGRVAIAPEIVSNVVGYFVLYAFVFSTSVFVLTALGLDIITSLGAVAATFNGVGPGLGLVGPTDNYAQIPAAGKWLLSFVMLLGRLEVYTVIILFSPSYWKK